MNDVRTALEEWLENVEGVVKFGFKLKQELVYVAALGFIAGYEAASKREWVGLTDYEIMKIGRELGLKCRLGGNPNIDFDYAREIETKLKEKNHDSV